MYGGQWGKHSDFSVCRLHRCVARVCTVLLLAQVIGELNSLQRGLRACRAAAAICDSIDIANSDKESSDGGTGTSTTTGTVAVSCDDGYFGSGNAVCTADSGASTAALQFAGCSGE